MLNRIDSPIKAKYEILPHSIHKTRPGAYYNPNYVNPYEIKIEPNLSKAAGI
jgi:hypothetical protein